MNKEQYAVHWERESKDFDSHGVYEKLSEFLPSGKVLEIGCGIGLGTYQLSKNHEVLSLDNNNSLIQRSKKYLKEKNIKHMIHNCDLLKLTNNNKNVIKQYVPQIIVGWFLGVAGNELNKYFNDEFTIPEKALLYREKLEDVIISEDLLLSSVEIVNFAIRYHKSFSMTKDEIFLEQKTFFDKELFNQVGFEVTNVELFEWNRGNSNFNYSSVHTIHEKSSPFILSIIAKRIK